MNFLKRALLAVSRRKGKSLIILVLFFAIANMVLAGLAIQHATNSASVLARQKLGGQLTLSYDRSTAMQKARASGEERPKIQTEPVTEAMAEAIAQQKNIADFNYIVNANGTADGFTAVVTDSGTETESDTNDRQMRGGFGADANFVLPDVSVTGVSSSALTDTFSNGAKIIFGRQINSQDANQKVALIEKNLAEQNGLKVGSKIKVKATRSDTSVEYSIVGIYEASTTTTSSQGSGRGNMSFTEPYNQIFVDYQSAIPLKSASSESGMSSGGIDSVVFFVDDPKNIDQVKTDAQAMNIDWSKFSLDANDIAYKQMMRPIETVASFSKMVVYIVAIAGALILALLLMLSIKERMYETGVLLSMGEGKLKIIGQYLAEVLIIALIAFGLAACSGKYIAQSASDMLIDREIQTAQTQSNDNLRPGGMGGAGFNRMPGRQQNYQPIDAINVQITGSELGQMASAGLIIILLGTIFPATTIMRYKPKTILTKSS